MSGFRAERIVCDDRSVTSSSYDQYMRELLWEYSPGVAYHTKYALANAQALVNLFCSSKPHSLLGGCGWGGTSRIFFNATPRSRCRSSSFLRYIAPILSACLSVMVAREKARRCEEVDTARLCTPWYAARLYISRGCSGAYERSRV